MKRLLLTTIAALCLVLSTSFLSDALAQQQQVSSTTGVQGRLPGDPPTQAPSITSPGNNQTFTSLPITVSGFCQTNLLVQIFKNGVFAGSVQCVGGSYLLQIDLFSGRNDLIARQYDALDQASPDSNSVTVTLNDSLPAGTTRPTITSGYSKRGANPNETLVWPISISGGTAPYALNVDWGDKSAPDLLSIAAAGAVDLKHIYKLSGVFNVTIKLSDAANQVAFLQLVAVGNGAATQATTGSGTTSGAGERPSYLLPLILTSILLPVSFLLGRLHDRQTIRTNLKKGKSPF